MKITITLLAACVSLAALPAFAIEDELERIVAIDEPRERLAAFDDFAMRQLEGGADAEAAALAPDDSSEDTGQWNVSRDVSPVDDSITHVLSLSADDEVVPDFPYDPYRPSLLIRYREGDLEVYVAYNETLAYGDDPVKVLSRVGKQDAVSTTWDTSASREAVFHPGDTVTFVRELLSAETLVIRVRTVDGYTRTSTFDLTGLQTAIEPISKAMAERQRGRR